MAKRGMSLAATLRAGRGRGRGRGAGAATTRGRGRGARGGGAAAGQSTQRCMCLMNDEFDVGHIARYTSGHALAEMRHVARSSCITQRCIMLHDFLCLGCHVMMFAQRQGQYRACSGAGVAGATRKRETTCVELQSCCFQFVSAISCCRK
jgi:hypothetical protein